MPKVIDARGLPCPQPVLRTKKAMEESDDIVTIVSSPDQAENVSRLAEKAGWAASVDGKEEGIYVRVTGRPSPPPPGPEAASPTRPRPTVEEKEGQGGRGEARPLVLLIPSEIMGRGEQELGTVLVRAFFHTLPEMDTHPDTVIFLNSGVKLAVEGSPLLEDLQALAGGGSEILVCGTCLGYFDLKDRVAVGTVSNMYAIAEALLDAGRVVSL